MKAHTNSFKEQIKNLGRELDAKITYTINSETIILTSENLNRVNPHYDGNILKSVMKELEIDSNIDIPKNTIINLKIGIKMNEEYEYLDYGNYIVYLNEKQEDTNSFKISCYDKLLYSMKDYEELNVEYPITIRNYINAICVKLGLAFANKNDTFANYDKLIEQDLYVNQGYTFRDILDELAQVTASTICLNENDEVKIRYINNTNDTIDEEFFSDTNVTFKEKYGPVNSIVLSRSAESDNIYLRNEESITTNGLCEIKIIDNQIMNWNNRDEFLPDILEKLNGLEYYLNDFSSKGILYYDLCDRYNIQIGENNYFCIMLNDDIILESGLEENIFTDKLNESQTDYSKADKMDRKINQTFLIVDKVNQTISSVVESAEEIKNTKDELETKLNQNAITSNNNYQDILNKLNDKVSQDTITTITNKVEQLQTSTSHAINVVEELQQNGATQVKTENNFTFDKNGLLLDKTGAPVKNQLNENGMEIISKTGASQNTQFFSGYVTQAMASKNPALTPFVGQTITFSNDIYVKNFVKMTNGRWENVEHTTWGKGIGVFIGGDE